MEPIQPTPYEIKKAQVNEFIERTDKVRSERIHEELKELNVANKFFGVDQAHVDVYV